MNVEMKKLNILSSIVALAFMSCQANARPVDSVVAEKIAKKSLCLGCHAVDQKAVGPSFKLIAKKYQNNSQARELLMPKVKNGGVGNWGVIAMPANSKHINDDDLRIVLDWILAGAPQEKK